MKAVVDKYFLSFKNVPSFQILKMKRNKLLTFTVKFFKAFFNSLFCSDKRWTSASAFAFSETKIQ